MSPEIQREDVRSFPKIKSFKKNRFNGKNNIKRKVYIPADCIIWKKIVLPGDSYYLLTTNKHQDLAYFRCGNEENKNEYCRKEAAKLCRICRIGRRTFTRMWREGVKNKNYDITKRKWRGSKLVEEVTNT